MMQEMMGGSGIVWTICISFARRCRQPCKHLIIQFLQVRCSSWHPTNSVWALMARS